MKMKMDNKKKLGERGSLSLEHILFIGAIVLIGAGLGVFYTNIGTYFQNVQLGNPTNVGNFMPVAGGVGGGGAGGGGAGGGGGN